MQFIGIDVSRKHLMRKLIPIAFGVLRNAEPYHAQCA